jgi:hypothetical protein
VKINYKLRGKSNTLFYRYINYGIDVTLRLPYLINRKDWDPKRQLFISNFELNKSILEFRHYLIEQTNKAINDNLIIDKNWLKYIQQSYFNPSAPVKEYTLLEYLDIYTNKISNESTLKKLRTLKLWMNNEPEILLKNITLNWFSQFTKKYLKKDYAESTIAKQISLIKRVLRDANINDVNIDMRALSFKPPKLNSISS